MSSTVYEDIKQLEAEAEELCTKILEACNGKSALISLVALPAALNRVLRETKKDGDMTDEELDALAATIIETIDVRG